MPPRRRSTFALAAILLALAPAAAGAYDWQNGDVFVGLSTGQYNVYDNGGTLHETIDQTTTGAGNFAVDCAFDRAGVLYTTAFTQNTIVRFLSPAPHTRLADIPSATNPESVSFARDGTFWVGHQANPSSLAHFDSGGSPIATFSPTAPASMLDLSADQRTMFYTDRSLTAAPVIHRFDVQTGTNLPDFANLGGGTRTIADFKLLPPGDGSGGAIVADGATIKRVNGQGQIVQTYDFAGKDNWFGIALDPDGKSFWAQNSTPDPAVLRFNIATGAADRGPLPSATNAFGICVRGTRTAAIDNAPPTITITSPGRGKTFRLGQRVRASYKCVDDKFGTGVASCSGPVSSGARIDTASVGRKTFRVQASDVAGNTASVTRTYTVSRTRRVALQIVFKGLSKPHGALLLTSLKITRLTRGARVELRCLGGKKKGCPFKRKKVSRPKRRNIAKLLRHHVLKQKAVLEFRATKRHFIGAVADMKIGKGTATLKFRCLPPGKTKPRRRC